MTAPYDVIIAGGGVIGSSIAYHLSASPGAPRIAVIERDPTYARASSSLSTSAIRQQFATEPNIRLSDYSIAFLRDIEAHLHVEGHTAHIALHEPGYLILGTPAQAPLFHDRVATQHACGIRTELLEPAEITRRHPWLNPQGVAIAAYGPEKEGWFDGPALLQAFRRKARAQGVTYLADEITAIDRTPTRITGIRLASGARLACGTLVNAAGAWSGQLAAMAGLHVPVIPRKRCVFVIETPADLGPSPPFLFDTTGCFLRPEGPLYLCGAAPRTENPPDDFSLEVDHALFDDVIWPALAHRVPALQQLRLRRAWAGLYEHNAFDHSALAGRHPGLPNLVHACGFSGHGMMHSPAAGAGIADLILHDEYRRVDLTPFAFERIAARQPIPEHVY